MSINNDTKIAETTTVLPDIPETSNTIKIVKDWNQLLLYYKDNTQKIDLRSLDSAQVVPALSRELEYLHPKAAFLFVLQKHLPVTYLDQLVEEKFDYHIKIIAPGEVQTLIFRQ